ncbi:hypothetical protein IBX73_02105 [candidate division WOR-3 bacterium]|nr:hypothetical protein [candidate division WOR-3 bacterium]
MITRTEFQEIIKLDGQVRGSALNTDAAYVESQEGRAALHRVETTFQTMGYPLQYTKINSMGWYPVCLRVLSLRLIQDVLMLDEAGLRTMGDAAPKFSFLVRVGVNLPLLPAAFTKKIPGYWRRHYRVGELWASEMNGQERSLRLQLRNFRLHPVLCRYFEGYFGRLLQFGFADQQVECRETKCVYEGDACHEYELSWQ